MRQNAGPARRGRGRRWLAPLAVAAATAVTVAAITVLHRGFSRPDLTSLAGAPRYALTVREDGRAEMLDSASGRVVESFAPTTGKYVAVTGDGRTFFLADQESGCDARIDKVVIGAGRPFPGGAVSTNVDSMALSPDGEHLAISGNCGPGNLNENSLTVIDTERRTLRSWTSVGVPHGLHATWAPDNRTIGFIWWSRGLTENSQIRLLDTVTAGTSLLKSGVLRGNILLRGRPIDQALIDTFVFNPDGRTLTVSVQGAKGEDDRADYALEELSAVNGEPTGRVVATVPIDPVTLSADRSGQHFVGIADGGIGRVESGHFSWLAKGRGYRDIAW